LETRREKKRKKNDEERTEFMRLNGRARATTSNACCFSYSYMKCCSNHINEKREKKIEMIYEKKPDLPRENIVEILFFCYGRFKFIWFVNDRIRI